MLETLKKEWGICQLSIDELKLTLLKIDDAPKEIQSKHIIFENDTINK